MLITCCIGSRVQFGWNKDGCCLLEVVLSFSFRLKEGDRLAGLWQANFFAIMWRNLEGRLRSQSLDYEAKKNKIAKKDRFHREKSKLES